MDFLDPRKKRAHKIRLLVGYFLMAVAISFGTLILLLESFGYDVYSGSDDIVHNGLVFVGSMHQQAQIYVNGRPEGRTEKRLVLPEGDYSLELQRDGYRMWTREFRLRGASVERVTYPLLVPEELDSEETGLYASSPLLATQSPDRRWLIVLQPDSLRSFDVIDIGQESNPVTSITLPEGVVTPSPGEHSLEMVEWSTDNRHVMLKHKFRGGEEFIMVDWREPELSFNVSESFSIPITQVALRDKRFDQLHVLGENRTLWFGEPATGRLTPLANQVRAFKSHGAEELLYVTEEEAPEGKALLNLLSGGNIFTIRDLPKSPRYVLDLARFDRRWYVAAGASAEKRAYVYRNPLDMLASDNPRTPAPVAVLSLDAALTSLSFSANARFIGGQSGSEFSVYDAEHDRQYKFDTELSVAENNKATWMDGHRYSVVSEDKAVMFEFDGSNQVELSASSQRFQPFFDRDYERLYTLSPSSSADGQTAFTRTHLLIEADR